VRLCTDGEASLAGLRALLAELAADSQDGDQLLFYFAGHGISMENDRDELRGFFVPADANPSDSQTLLPMTEVRDLLVALPCRHELLILDCCFAGALKLAGRRASVDSPPMFRERFQRYADNPARQVLASAAYDEEALDLVVGHAVGRRDAGAGGHSPFAEALVSGLRGDADADGDGLITAEELLLYIERRFADLETQRQAPMQRPELASLRQLDKGRYLFFHPARPLSLAPASALTAENNPYRGLQPYEAGNRDLFFGREALAVEVASHVTAHPLTVLVGASGVGKSSLLRAGVLPILKVPRVVGPLRPGPEPLQALERAWADATGLRITLDTDDALARAVAGETQVPVVLAIDQLEELSTMTVDRGVRARFLTLLRVALDQHPERLHVVGTLRSDFEPQLESEWPDRWAAARVVVPQLSRAELRAAIEQPAERRAIFFDPPQLVDDLVGEVEQMPGMLPLLSFTLSELYRMRVQRQDDERTLTAADYQSIGRVAGALQHRIKEIHDALAETPVGDGPTRGTMRRLLLRMVSADGNRRSRRRVSSTELEYADVGEGQRMARLVEELTTARLIVPEADAVTGGRYFEPAHDALVESWSLLDDWILDEQRRRGGLVFRRGLTAAVEEWRDRHGISWDGDPRLEQAAALWRATPEELNRDESRFVAASVRQRRTRRLRAISIIALVVASLSGLTAVAVKEARSERAARAKEEQQRRGLQARLALERMDSRGVVVTATALVLDAASPSLTAGEPLPPQVHEALLRVNSQTVMSMKIGESGTDARFSPDGTKVVIFGHPHGVSVLDGFSGKAIVEIGHEWADASFIAEDRILLKEFDGKKSSTSVYDLRLKELHPLGEVRAAKVPVDAAGRWLLIHLKSSALRMVELRTGLPKAVMSGTERSWNSGGQLSPDGSRVIGDGKLWRAEDGSAIVIDFDANRFAGPRRILGLAGYRRVLTDLDGKRVADLGPRDPLRDDRDLGDLATLHVSPDGALAAEVDQRGLTVWKLDSGKPMLQAVEEKRESSERSLLRFSPASDRLLVAGKVGGRILSLAGGRPPTVVAASAHILAAAFSPDGESVATVDAVGVHVWNAQSGRLEVTLDQDEQRSVSGQPEFSADGTRLLLPGNPTRMFFFAGGRPLRRITAASTAGSPWKLSPDGALLARVVDSHVEIVDTDSGSRTAVPSALPREMAFAGDGSALVAAVSDHQLAAFDVRTGAQLRTLEGEVQTDDLILGSGTLPVRGILDSEAMRIGAGHGTEMWLWRLDTGKLEVHASDGKMQVQGKDFDVKAWTDAHQKESRAAVEAINQVATDMNDFSIVKKDARFVQTSLAEVPIIGIFGARVFLVRQEGLTAKLGISLQERTAVLAAALSADLTRLATATELGVTLWDLATRRMLATWSGCGTVRDLAFAHGGDRLAVVTERGLYTIDAGARDQLAFACKIVTAEPHIAEIADGDLERLRRQCDAFLLQPPGFLRR
jgi:WD40 repeat protein